jgi:PAS domain S-box-containing protein
MRKEDNTNEQLINELTEMRQRIAELGVLETDRRQAEEEFRKVQERFSGIYNSSKDAIGYATPEGILIDVNDSFLRLTGYSRDELLNGKKYQDITPQEYHEYESQMVEKVLNTGEPVEYEKEYIRKDGSRVPILLTVFMVKGTDNRPLGLAAIIKDLIDRRVLHEKSQKQAEELRTLYEDLNRRNKDLEILNTITQAVHQSLELEEVYKVALDMTIALENIDMAMIYLVDKDRKEAILQAHRNVPEDYIRSAGRIPYPKGITWKVINTGEIINVEDAQKDPDIGPAGRDLGHHGIVGAPITLEGRVIGVVWFISYKEHQFSKQEIDLLSSIGSQIAIAIAKAKLYRELSKKNRYETIISTVTRSVHQSINLQDVLENAVESMSRNIDGIDIIGILVVEGEEAVLKAHRGYPDWFLERVGRIPYPKGFTWKTITEGKPRYVADTDQDTVIGPAGREVGTKSYICMPIHFRGKTVGVININSFQKNAFNEEDLRLLEIVTQQIEVAINNAQQTEKLRLKSVIVGNMAEGVALARTRDNMIVYVNPAFERMFGYSPDELNGKSALILSPFGDNTLEHPETKRIIECVNQNGMWSGEMLKLKKDGTLFWSHASVWTFEHPQHGKVWVGIHTDITERKRAEEELRESEENYRNLFENVPIGAYRTTPDGRILMANPTLIRMLGYTSFNELASRNLEKEGFDASYPRDQFKDLLEQRGEVRGLEYTWISRDDTKIFVRENTRAVRGQDRTILYYEGTVEDITERTLTEEQLKNSHEQLRTLAAHLQLVREEERARIAREIHDELSQTLTGVQMSLSWLSKKLSKADNNEELHSLLLEEIASMSKLIDTTTQAVQEISTELRPVVLDDLGLTAAIEWQTREFQTRMGIRCRFTLSPKNITLDKEQSTAIFRLLQETLTNVARHAYATSVNVSLKKKAGNLILEVRDNGKGITESEISNPRSLGLLGMKERALLLGGELRISGTPGKGTTVTIRIPY